MSKSNSIDEKTRKDIALFRFGLIAPVINGNVTAQMRYFRQLAQKEHNVPLCDIRDRQVIPLKVNSMSKKFWKNQKSDFFIFDSMINSSHSSLLLSFGYLVTWLLVPFWVTTSTTSVSVSSRFFACLFAGKNGDRRKFWQKIGILVVVEKIGR